LTHQALERVRAGRLLTTGTPGAEDLPLGADQEDAWAVLEGAKVVLPHLPQLQWAVDEVNNPLLILL